MRYGIKVSKEGSDVGTAVSTTDNVTFVTDYPVFKVAQEDEGTLSVAENDIDAFTSIPHGLGYKPYVRIYIQNDVGANERHLIQGRDPFAFPAADSFDPVFYMSVDNTYFWVGVSFPSNVPDAREYKFQYYVIYDETGLA